MTINLYNCEAEMNRIGKNNKSLITSLSGTLKQESSIIDPIIMLQLADCTGINYAYIEEFKRYYFVSEIRQVRNDLVELTMHVDVLDSFKDAILKNTAILDKSQSTGNPYFDDGSMASDSRTFTQVYNYGNGFLSDPELILITAGA